MTLVIYLKEHKFIHNFQNSVDPIRVLARPYLMTLYVIFPIHFNFPIRSKCVLKAIQWLVLRLLEKLFSFSKWHFLWYCTCLLYLIHYFILSRSIPIFLFSLSIIYLLFLSYHILCTCFFLNICKGFSL